MAATNILLPTNCPDVGLEPIQNHVSAVVGSRRWLVATTSSVPLDQLDVEMNGVGCAVQSMRRSGEWGMLLINLIALIMHERKVCLRMCFTSYFFCCRDSSMRHCSIIYFCQRSNTNQSDLLILALHLDRELMRNIYL